MNPPFLGGCFLLEFLIPLSLQASKKTLNMKRNPSYGWTAHETKLNFRGHKPERSDTAASYVLSVHFLH